MNLLCFILGCQIALAPTTYQVKDACPDVECWIEVYAEQYGVDVEVAKRIAVCESQMGKYRENWEGSGAVGVFQFKPKTFFAYCEGNIQSDKDQTKCFMQLYPVHPSWWECK